MPCPNAITTQGESFERLFAAIPSLPDKTPFAAMVLVEPVFAPKDLYEEKIRNQGIAMFSKAIAMRRDIWDSKEQAYEHMKKRLPWKAWDDAVLRIYIVCIISGFDVLL